MSTTSRNFASLGSMRKSHSLQRYQLELTLETSLRDSRYSPQLVELMKQEETLLREGSPSHALNDLIARVDRALTDETGRYFNKVSSQNIKRWQSLLGKLNRERDASRSLFREPVPAHGKASRRTVTADDLDAEAIRLEEIYNKVCSCIC